VFIRGSLKDFFAYPKLQDGKHLPIRVGKTSETPDFTHFFAAGIIVA
jgi:hypothetical protein